MLSSDPTHLPASTVRSDPPEAWLDTTVQTAMATQLMQDKDDYLAAGPQALDVGRLTATDTWELFVSCDPAEALQQQFEHLQPEYIAIHDIGTPSSRKLLAGVAAASSRAVQKLVIRRQGYGTALASIDFLEVPRAGGRPLRIYSTEVEGDSVHLSGMTKTLLAYSRLGVLMVADLPAHAIASALTPFREFILRGPWLNRQLLLLPLGAGSSLASKGTEMVAGTGVTVRTTPQVTRPADAWGFIDGTWNRVFAAAAPPKPDEGRWVVPAAAPGPRPMPTLTPRQQGHEPLSLIGRYVQDVGKLGGAVSCCVFDAASGQDLAHAGASPTPADLARHGTALLAAMSSTSRALGMGHVLPEVAITLGSHHLLLRAVPRHPGLALHVVLDKANANLTLFRLQLARLDPLFDAPTPPA